MINNSVINKCVRLTLIACVFYLAQPIAALPKRTLYDMVGCPRTIPLQIPPHDIYMASLALIGSAITPIGVYTMLHKSDGGMQSTFQPQYNKRPSWSISPQVAHVIKGVSLILAGCGLILFSDFGGNMLSKITSAK